MKTWVVNEFGPCKWRGPCTDSLDQKACLQFHSDRGFQNVNAILGTQPSQKDSTQAKRHCEANIQHHYSSTGTFKTTNSQSHSAKTG